MFLGAGVGLGAFFCTNFSENCSLLIFGGGGYWGWGIGCFVVFVGIGVGGPCVLGVGVGLRAFFSALILVRIVVC